MFIAAPEEPSDWWVQPSAKSVGFEDERRLLVLLLQAQVVEVVLQARSSNGALLFAVT